MTSEQLRTRAAALGIETTYEDTEGVRHDADLEVLARVIAVLEADRASAADRAIPPVHVVHATSPGSGSTSGHATTVSATGAVSDAQLTVAGNRHGVEVCRGEPGDEIVLPDDLPIGCHLLEVAGPGGGECVVVVSPGTMVRSPAFAGRSALFVPTYALWSRGDPLPAFHHLAELAAALPSHGIDVVSTLPLYAPFLDRTYDPSPYSPVSRFHWNELYIDDDVLPAAPVPQLGELVDWAPLAERRRRQLLDAAAAVDDELAAQLTAFVAAHPDVGSYARFMAGRDQPSGTGATLRIVERSHVLAQYLADRQLASIGERSGSAALALDLPIGSHPDGWETWANPTLFATDMAVGAPPDSFFTEGQNWGFPPQLPYAGHLTGHRLWRQMITRAGRHADLLRIDHAMAVHRLWWVPDGFSADKGVYVRYPRDELLAVIAATAAATDLTIVGEDLGTVPPEVRDAFEQWDMLGMYEEQFHLDDDPLLEVPPRTVAGVRTHDMAAFAELEATTDLTSYRRQLAGLGDDLLDGMLGRLARSDAYLVAADLDDLVGETRPHNLPGRVVPGLWQRRLEQPATELLDDPTVRRRLAILGRTTT